MAKFHYKDTPSEKQKKVFSKYLSEDEELVLVTGLSQAYIRSKFMTYFLMPGLIVGGLSLGLFWLLGIDRIWAALLAFSMMIFTAILKTMHIYHANRYLLTTRRILIKQGLFSVKITTALYDKITHIEVDQSFVDRVLLHHGTIIINTAGVNKGEVVLQSADYPLELKNLLERLINREREQFGMRGATLTEIEGEIIS